MNFSINNFINSHRKILIFMVYFQILFASIYSIKFDIQFPSLVTLFIFALINFLFIFYFLKCYKLFSVISVNNQTIGNNLKILSSFIIIICFIQLLNIKETLINSFTQLVLSSVSLNESYINSRIGQTTSSGFNFISILSNSFRTLIPLLVYLHLKLKNGLIDKYSFLLLFSNLILLLQSFSFGQRGLIISVIFEYIFFIILLYKDSLVIDVAKKKILRFGFYILIIMSTGFIAITISRFSNSYSRYKPLESVYAYQGQGLINLDKIFTSSDKYDKSRNLNRILPISKAVLGINSPIDYDSRMRYYYDLPSNESEFSTWIGDLSLDFHRILLPFVILFLGIFVYLFSRLGSLNALVSSYILWIILTEGTNLFPFADISGNLRLIVLLLLPFILKLKFK